MTSQYLLGLDALVVLLGVGWLWVRADGVSRPWPLVLARAHLIGSAILGVGVTVGLVLTDHVWLPAILATYFVASAAAVLRQRHSPPCDTSPELGDDPTREELRLRMMLWALILVGLGTALARWVLLPTDWDGWAIWQLKARAIAAGDLYRLLTSPQYSYAHPDYPLLIPTQSWWLSGGGFTEKIGQGVDFLYFLDLLAVFYYEARERIKKTAALAGLAVMLSWAPLLKHSASGFADVPMAAFCLAATCALLRREFWLAGALLCGAALTKNEGLFTLAAAGALVVLLPGYRANPRAWAPIAAAVLLALLPWTVMKHRWELHADLLDPSQWPKDPARVLPGRAVTIAVRFTREALSFGPKYPGWGSFWPLAAAGAAWSAYRREARSTGFWVVAGVLLAGTITAYLITPADPAGHMDSSLDRLALHAAPVVLLGLLTTFCSPTPAYAEAAEPN